MWFINHGLHQVIQFIPGCITSCRDHDVIDTSSKVPLQINNLYFKNWDLTVHTGTDPYEKGPFSVPIAVVLA